MGCPGAYAIIRTQSCVVAALEAVAKHHCFLVWHTYRHHNYLKQPGTATDESVFQTYSKWTGEASIKAFWPLNTESDLDAKLRKCIDEYKELVNGQGIHTDGIRSIDSTLSLRFAREDAKEFIDKIRELTSLINQADPIAW